MPAYLQSTAGNPITALYPGGSVDVIVAADTVVNGFKSQALALSNYPGWMGTNGSLDIVFSGAPGTFTFWVQFSAKDVDADYATPDPTYEITAANLDASGLNHSVHLDMPYTNARFERLYVQNAPSNSVTTIATFKR